MPYLDDNYGRTQKVDPQSINALVRYRMHLTHISTPQFRLLELRTQNSHSRLEPLGRQKTAGTFERLLRTLQIRRQIRMSER